MEEINIVSKGGNYGWNWKEGDFHYYDTTSTGRYLSNVPQPGLPAGLLGSTAEYSHESGSLGAVIGGYVYRGTQVTALAGRYVFGDFIKRLFYLDGSQQAKEFLGAGVADFVTGFGQDSDNELYVLTRVSSDTTGTNGKLQKIKMPGSAYSSPDPEGESAQCPPGKEMCVPVKATNGSLFLICL